MRRNVVRIVLPLGLLIAVIVSLSIFAGGEKRPNVILISIDSLRADHLHCYGYDRNTSPHIDQLAREGVLFVNTFSSSGWTLPAHVSMLTSLVVPTHGVVKPDKKIDRKVKTLAQALKEHGYTTAGFISAVFVHAIYGFDKGFDVYEDLSADPSILEKHPDSTHVIEAIFSDVEGITSPRITRRVTQWLHENRKKPFFLFLHYFDVHYDYMPPPPYDTMFDPGYTGTISAKNYYYNDAVNPNMSPADLKHIIALYDGEIRFVDEHIGLLLERLKESHLDKNTIIIVTADHGEEFFEHGGKDHRTLYDEVLRIPLIIKWPGHIPEGKRVNSLAGIIDIMPTVLDLACGDTTGTMMGKSLRNQIFGDGNSSSPPLLGELVCLHNDSHLFSLRTDKAKIIFDSTYDKTYIYDLANDPGETEDLGQNIKAVSLKEDLERQLQSAMKNAVDKKKEWHIKEGSLEKLSKAQEKNLKSLGYIQ